MTMKDGYAPRCGYHNEARRRCYLSEGHDGEHDCYGAKLVDDLTEPQRHEQLAEQPDPRPQEECPTGFRRMLRGERVYWGFDEFIEEMKHWEWHFARWAGSMHHDQVADDCKRDAEVLRRTIRDLEANRARWRQNDTSEDK